MIRYGCPLADTPYLYVAGSLKTVKTICGHLKFHRRSSRPAADALSRRWTLAKHNKNPNLIGEAPDSSPAWVLFQQLYCPAVDNHFQRWTLRRGVCISTVFQQAAGLSCLFSIPCLKSWIFQRLTSSLLLQGKQVEPWLQVDQTQFCTSTVQIMSAGGHSHSGIHLAYRKCRSTAN